jgi:hypothetical protein
MTVTVTVTVAVTVAVTVVERIAMTTVTYISLVMKPTMRIAK